MSDITTYLTTFLCLSKSILVLLKVAAHLTTWVKKAYGWKNILMANVRLCKRLMYVNYIFPGDFWKYLFLFFRVLLILRTFHLVRMRKRFYIMFIRFFTDTSMNSLAGSVDAVAWSYMHVFISFRQQDQQTKYVKCRFPRICGSKKTTFLDFVSKVEFHRFKNNFPLHSFT